VDFTSLTASEVGRHYGRRKALSQISFECRGGEIVGLLGPNGAGKSTLLAILATLLTPSTGRVLYGDRTAQDAGAAVRGRIGLLGHELFLYPELTARENLLFFARLYDLPQAEAVVEASLGQANLTDRADDRVGSFSRGMRQRLALERAPVHTPRLLLLDEPFTGPDQASRRRSWHGAGAAGPRRARDRRDARSRRGRRALTRAIYLRNGRIVREDHGAGQLRERYQAAMSAS
jgi:ABC-type multidrug transport system ATPase subunit